MTAKGGDGAISAATVNWVTQTAFEPPLIAIGVKADSGLYANLKEGAAFWPQHVGQGRAGHRLRLFQNRPTLKTASSTARPIMMGPPGRRSSTRPLERSSARSPRSSPAADHHIVIGEVVDAHQSGAIDGRPDAAILEMKELGDNVFYGG